MNAKVLIVLLLFGVQLLNGQTVSKLEFKNGTEVYEIIELQNNTVEFVNPVKSQPTLREIIFYKVIEKPYMEKNDEQKDVVIEEKEKIKKPDFDETVRPFTNGHGLQFVEWGSQDENMQHTYAPEKEKVANDTSTNNDSDDNPNDDKNNDKDNLDDDYDEEDIKNKDKTSHVDNDNDDEEDDNKNNDKISKVNKDDDNDDDEDDNKNNDKISKVNKDDDNDDDEDDNKNNDKKSNINIDNDNDDMSKEHLNNYSKNNGDEDNNHDEDDKSSGGGEKVVDVNGADEKKIIEDKVKEETNKEEDEKTREDKIHEEELNLAKKLRSELFNSTKEKYHTLIRNHENATHERRKRDVSYQSIPDAPTLPDLDIKAFPAYVQRMLANRPTISQSSQDNAKTTSNYNSDLFHKMNGMFSNNNAKTYGFKYNNDKSESWNDMVHETQGNDEPTFRDLSGSQTNNPYEKIPDSDIDIRNNVVLGEDTTLSKKKDEVYENPKNNFSNEINEVGVDDIVVSKQKILELNNKKPNNPDKLSDINIKDKLITMFQNIDNKFSNGQPPKTYGMSIKGDKVETWNDIVKAPIVSNNKDTHKENIFDRGSENKSNKGEGNFNTQNNINRLNIDIKRIADNNEETTTKVDIKRFENIPLNRPEVDENLNVATDKMHSLNGDNEKDLDNYEKETVPNVDSAHHENIAGYQAEANLSVGKDKKSPEEEDEDNYDEELDEIPASTNKIENIILERPTEQPYNEENYYDEINEPTNSYEESKNSDYIQPNNDRTTNYDQVKKSHQFITETPIVHHASSTETEDSKEEKESSLTDNEDLKHKMEESFDNIIKRFPKLEEMKKTEDKTVEDLNKFDDNNKKDNDKPKTYGMHLEGDHGYIWNELINSGKPIYVGNLENIKVTESSIHHESTTTKITENKIENHTELPKPTTNRNDEKVTEAPIATTTEKQVTVAEEHKETTEIPKVNKLDDKKNCNCSKDKINENKDIDKSNKNETDTVKMTLDELLKKDVFWQWLTNWTSTYMEVLNERVETLVKNEVADQLKQISDAKNNNKTNGVGDKFDKGNKTIDDNIDKESDGIKVNTTDCTKIDDGKTNNNTSTNTQLNTTTIALEPEKSNNEINSTIEKNNNNTETVSGGNESSKTNKTDEDFSKGKNKTSPLNIKSGTIYGNAIGNDHVTNIFIFYPSVDSNKTIEKLESTINKTNSDVTILGEKPVNITFDERLGMIGDDKDNNVDEVISKTKDLLNGEKNKSSTISTEQQNKEDDIDKNKNASNDNTEENPPTAPTTKAESTNKTNNTDSKSPNEQDSIKATTELNENTIDKTNSDTKEIDNVTTTGAPTKSNDETTQSSKDDKDATTPKSPLNYSTDAKTEKPDSTTEKSELTPDKPDLTKSDSTTEKSDLTTEKSDATTKKSDSTTEKSDSTTVKPDSTTEKSDSTTEKSDSTTEKSDSTTEKSDSTTEKSDSTTEKSDSKDTSDGTSTEKSTDS